MPNTPFSIGSDVWPGLGKVVEESGELQAVLGKLIATRGSTQYFDGTDLLSWLYEELGDLQASLDFFIEANDIDRSLLAQRSRRKLTTYREWHSRHLNGDGDHEAPQTDTGT